VATNYTWTIFLPLNYLKLWLINTPNRKGTPQDLKPKTVKLKRGDIRVRTRADVTAILWRDKRDVCMLINIHGAQRKVISVIKEEKPQSQICEGL
jgi:hypothetical protein